MHWRTAHVERPWKESFPYHISRGLRSGDDGDGEEDRGGEEERRPGKQIGDLLKPYLTSESKILMLGCGNSNMSEQMYRHGFEDILNVDISENLLEKLRQRLSASAPRMRWQYANASALDFPEKSFDVIIDKGTFDAMEQNKPLVAAAFREAHRTLRPGGFLISVTFNSALQRVENQLRQADDWGDCRTVVFERPAQKQRYYLHACQREQ
ncbi:unnamed protein product [Prorocentrum cordatum]|uniref:Methyltransferase domain-containing protein n=1 Tax=Prorocentrum cordatum TaxID=2364126 RepID=A0ABN9Y5H8_9DINO|nr:unnamed protein product [Polarella glacialis]